MHNPFMPCRAPRGLARRSITQALIAAGLIIYLPLASAATGDVAFKVKSTAASVFLGCNGAPLTLYNNVVPVYADTNGSNSATANQVSGNACPGLLDPVGQQMYYYESVYNSANAEDDDTLDDGETKIQIQKVSFLGGLLTYDKETYGAACTETSQLNCTANTVISNLKFEGRRITGEYNQKQVFPAEGLKLQLNNATCNGLTVFTGNLTINDEVVSADGRTVDFYPLVLDGKVTCLGIPADTVAVHIAQDLEIDFQPVNPVERFGIRSIKVTYELN